MTGVIYIEWVWTAIAMLGVLFSTLNLLDVIQDRRLVRDLHINDARAIIARGHVRTESIRLLIQLIFFAIGCIALLTPPFSVDHDDIVLLLRAMIPLGLIAGIVLLVVKSLLDRIDRKRIIKAELEKLQAQEYTPYDELD